MATTECDYLIIGAGSAGCVLANRLSADQHNRVHVLEAGPMDWHPMIHVPAGVYRVYRDPAINWNYQTEAEAGCFDRSIEVPRGKVVGGSSSINSMVYMRGHPLDYDTWASDYGLPHWSYANCLPYFKRSETSDRPASVWRGSNGPLGVRRGQLENPLFDAMLLAGEQSGQGTSDDLNAHKPEGIARLDGTVRHGRRCSAAVAYLRPAMDRKNLQLTTRALVERLEIENGCVTGAVYRQPDGAQLRVVARKGVLLCAGAIKSPQLLMISGIGPSDQLARHGINCQIHAPEVGQNLQDHLFIRTAFLCKKPVALNYLANPLAKLKAGAQWLLKRNGVVASNIWEMGGLVYAENQARYPDAQYHFAPVFSEFEGRKLNMLQGYQLNCDQLRPKSRGRISLNSALPADRPLVNFNYLSADEDLAQLVAGNNKMQELMQQPAFDEFRGQRITPQPQCNSPAEIENWIRQTASTDFHPCGTCRMGGDSDSVVDEQLRVRGVDRLWVADASVMPAIVSGNLNAPVMMIAERAADYVLGNSSLLPERANFHFQS